jgi:hypothetical protein
MEFMGQIPKPRGFHFIPKKTINLSLETSCFFEFLTYKNMFKNVCFFSTFRTHSDAFSSVRAAVLRSHEGRGIFQTNLGGRQSKKFEISCIMELLKINYAVMLLFKCVTNHL